MEINNDASPNPFPGLRAFEEHEHVLFFGRKKQVGELLKKLQNVRFLSILGSSGSGKSSLIKSGLIPALHNDLVAGTVSQWVVCPFRPGNNPITNLARALVNNSSDKSDAHLSTIEGILRKSDEGLMQSCKGIDSMAGKNILVLADQFEELFRFNNTEKILVEGRRDAVVFIDLLIYAARQREIPIYIAISMRADFLGDCAEFAGLPEAINDGHYLVPRMSPGEVSTAITGPISLRGVEIEPLLLKQLLQDVGDNPDQLPILQHALMRTWDNWAAGGKTGNTQNLLTLKYYEQ